MLTTSTQDPSDDSVPSMSVSREDLTSALEEVHDAIEMTADIHEYDRLSRVASQLEDEIDALEL